MITNKFWFLNEFLSIKPAGLSVKIRRTILALIMSKNPIINGLAASVYIFIVASVMNFGTRMMPHPNSFLAPVAVLSLFTLSAAVMGYIFCYQPAQLYFDGKKKEAVRLFLRTVAVFACITALMLILLFTGIFS